MGWSCLSFAQNIQRIEYFIDNDPGFGNGTDVPFTGSNIVTTNLSIPMPVDLSKGFHKFYVRAKNTNGVWSMVTSQNFFKTDDLSSLQNIVKLEYFINNDLGIGQGVNIPITANTNITSSFSVPLPVNLPNGFHKFLIRAKDISGKWSMIYSQSFFKTTDLPTLQNITKLEYFIDSDTGFGQGVNIPFSAGNQISQSFNISLASDLAVGFHKFCIRAKDVSGKWSTVFFQNFYKTNDLINLQNIVKLEYFVDIDPGVGLATNFPITSSNLLNIDEPIFEISPALLGGNHSLFIRAKDASGKWSMIAQKPFINCEVGATVSANPSPASCGTPINVNVTLQNNNSSSLSWSWFKNGIEIPNSANLSSVVATETSHFLVKLTTTGNGACNSTSSNLLRVFVRTADSVRIKTNVIGTNCNNAATLEVDSQNSLITNGFGVSYTWFLNNSALPNSNSPALTVTQGGTYKVRINYSGGLAACGFIESNLVEIQEKIPLVAISPISSLPDKIVVCIGTTIQLNAITDLTGNLSYQWFKNNQPLNGQTEANLLVSNAEGSYKVSISGGNCSNLTSASYLLSYSGSATESPTMNLVSGLLNSCPGSLATLSVAGCSGLVEWNNGFEGSSLSVTQLNSAFTYQAICRTTCMHQVASPKTFSPNGTTLAAASISVDDFPLTTRYSISPVSSSGHGTAYRYNEFSPAVAVASLEGGSNYYITSKFEFNAFKKTNSLLFHQTEISTGIPIININGVDIISLRNNHFLMAGFTNAGIVGDKSISSFGGDDFWILSRNISGAKLWDKAFGGSGAESLNKVLQLPNGDLILAGNSSSGISGNKTATHHGNNDFWVVKTDSLGNKLADFSYGGSGNDRLSDVLLLSNGNILLVGNSDSGISGNKTTAAIGSGDIWAVVINASGVKVWEKTFGTSQTEGPYAVEEKNEHLYIAVNSSNINGNGIYKINLNGDFVQTAAYTFNDYFPAISSSFTMKDIHKSPTNDLVVVGRVNGQATFGNIQYAYDYLLMFEIQEDLTIINTTKTTFGSTLSDDLGTTFFDKEGNFHLIKSNDIFNCPESGDPLYSLYYLDNSAQNTTLCNRGNITDGHWFKWTVSKYNFQSRSYTDFCKGKEFLLKASIPNQENLRNLQFNWSDGQTGQIIKITPQTRLPLYASYAQNGSGSVCGSTVASVNLYPYGDKLVLAGNNFTDANIKFAYKEISSSENLGLSANYKSEGGITLSPGFQISGFSNKVFKAEIGGCTNQ
ncbi:hypothetical protein EGI26_16850 [Lacihabitans sp. CCS-44]|nr:hypothetical protein [Lacihabitans sp. CCS-44]